MIRSRICRVAALVVLGISSLRAALFAQDADDTASIAAVVSGGDAAKIRAAVVARGADVWVLVDSFRAQGDPQTAVRLADAWSSPDQAALRDFARSVAAEPEGLRVAVREADARRRAEDVRGVISRLPSTIPERSPVLAVRALLLRADAASELGSESAVVDYAAAGKIAERVGWLRGSARAAWGPCEFAQARGQHAEVLARVPEFQRLAATIGDVNGHARAEAYRAASLAMLARYAEAAASFVAALSTFDRERDASMQVQLRAMLSGVRAKQGRYADALVALESAGDLLPKGESEGFRAELLIDEGDVWTELDEFERAGDRYQKAFALLGNSLSTTRAHVLASSGWLAHLRGASEEGLRQLEQSAADHATLGDAAQRANVLRAIGQVRLDLGEPEKAAHALREAIVLHVDASSEVAHTWICLAQAERAAARPDAAREALGRARPLLAGSDARDIVLLLDREEAVEALARGDTATALSSMRHAFDTLREIVTGLSDAGMVGTEAHRDRSPLCDIALDAAFRSADSAVEVEFLERTRASALLFALGGRSALKAYVSPAALVVREREASERLAAARARAATSSASNDLAASREDARAVDEARVAFEAANDALQRDGRRAQAVVALRIDTLAAIQTGLTEDECLVYFVLLPDAAWGLVLTRTRLTRHPLGPTAAIVEAVSRFAESIDDSAESVANAMKALDDLLVKPLALPSNVKRAVVVPDGPLSHVPLPALLAKGEMEASFAPSGTIDALLRGQRARDGSGVLAVGDPSYEARDSTTVVATTRGGALSRLPASRDEVAAITREGDVRLLGDDATEGRVLAEAARRPRWSSMHFACHGLVDSNRPGMSALALTNGGGGDGFLTATEAFDAGLSTDLVVLSACKSGRGQIARSEGSMSLARAFLAAGAPRVIVSLWDVDDQATRALMTEFYKQWRDEKRGTAAALAMAQAAVRAKTHWSHPRYWAAWVLWGRPE